MPSRNLFPSMVSDPVVKRCLWDSSREKKMAENQFDVSPKLVRLFKEKQKIREAVRQAVIQRQTNPHLKYGIPYDKAISKYHALWMYRNEHVYSNSRNVSVILGVIVFPIFVIYWDIIRHQTAKEKLLRSGKVAYEDRCYKQVL